MSIVNLSLDVSGLTIAEVSYDIKTRGFGDSFFWVYAINKIHTQGRGGNGTNMIGLKSVFEVYEKENENYTIEYKAILTFRNTLHIVWQIVIAWHVFLHPDSTFQCTS